MLKTTDVGAHSPRKVAIGLVRWCFRILSTLAFVLWMGVSLVAAQNVQPPDQQPSTTAEAPTAASAQQANANMSGHQGMLDPTLTTGVSLTTSDLGQDPDTRALTLFAAGTSTIVGAGLLSRGHSTGASSSSSGQPLPGGTTGTALHGPFRREEEQEDATLTLASNGDAPDDNTPLAQSTDDPDSDPSLGGTAASIGADLTPVVGEIKGLIEVFTGRDLITGEELGHWRWLGLAGIVGLNELRLLRYGDDVADAVRIGGRSLDHVGDVADQLRAGTSVTDLIRAGVAPSDLIRAGASADDLVHADHLLSYNDWRQLIDNPPPGRTVDDMRYQRYRQRLLDENETPKSREEWDQLSERLRENSARGQLNEENNLNSLGIDNNNYNTTASGQPRDVIRYRADIDGKIIDTRPDGISSSHWIDVKSTTGKQYRTKQLRAQIQGAEESGRRLAVVLTNNGQDVRPSGPLSRDADVFFRHSETGEWRFWDIEANNHRGGWIDITVNEARRLMGGSTP